MKPRTRRKPIFRILLGLSLMVVGVICAKQHFLQAGENLGLLAGGYFLYLWGCAAHARAKGYSAAQGILMGMIFPALLVFIAPDRTKMAKSDREELEREEKDEAAANLRAKRAPLHGPKKFIAMLLGIFFIALGVAAIAGYQIYWNRVVVPESNRLAGAISIDAGKIVPENEGKLVHVTGALAGATNLTDTEFGVAAEALSLRRRVWMYQWQQQNMQSKSSYGTVDAQGKETTYLKTQTYNYSKNWFEKLIDSRSFYNSGHNNPTEMKIPSRTMIAPDISLGALTIAPELSAQLDNYQPVSVNETNLAALSKPSRATASLADGGIFLGKDFNQPAIGDLKVKFESAPTTTVSIIARQNGNNLSPYPMQNAGLLALLKIGTFSVPQMTAQFAKANSQARWLVWIAGGVLFAFGFLLIVIARRK